MAILPIPLARVSNLSSSSSTLSSIAKTQQDLLVVQNQISSGKQVSVPSDNPSSAAIIQQLQKTLAQREAYAANLQYAGSQLGEADATLGDLTTLVQQAQTIASANVGSDTTASQRQAAAQIVKSISNQVLSIGNKQFNGVYIFAGDKSTAPPFVDHNGAVQFVGSTNVPLNSSDDNAALPYMIDGESVFGALTTQVAGAVNLAPAIAADTRLVDLGGAGGGGVHTGSIRIGNGTTTVDVDLSNAGTVGDVVNAINAAGLAGVTASLGASGLQLSGAGNISVNEIAAGTTASDLGILTPAGGGAGVAINGQSLQAQVTPLTRLSELRSGAGLDLSGLTITNGAATKALSFAGDTTVEDVLNQINGSKLGVVAQINAAGTGIDIVNSRQGTPMTIGENGGATAAQLGVRSLTTSTNLAALNGGQGVGTGPGPDLQVTRRDGTTFTLDVKNLHTVQDVIDAINTANAGGGVTASFAANTNGIVLTDSTGGAGTLSVASANGSSAAKDLGLTTTAAGNTLTGSDVNPQISTGLFANLTRLTSALENNDPTGITAAAAALQDNHNQVVLVRGQTGAKEQEVTSRQSQLADENLATKSLLSNLQDTDFTTAVTRFQTLQTALQANYEMTARLAHMSLLDFVR
jgi:flagellar hook-associated protein 3 FlgL